MGDKAVDRWAGLIRAAYQRSYYVKEKSAVLKVKEDIVAYSKYTWPLLFSRFYEAFRLDGPPLPKNDVSEYSASNFVRYRTEKKTSSSNEYSYSSATYFIICDTSFQFVPITRKRCIFIVVKKT